MDKLTVRFEHSRDDDDFGWLEFDVAVGDFRGRAGAFVQWQDLEEFSYDLAVYPIAAEAPVSAEWGIDPHSKGETNLVVAIEPADLRGGLNVTVKVASYYPEEMHRLTARFRTGYAELQDFARALRKIVKKEGEEAVLTAC